MGTTRCFGLLMRVPIPRRQFLDPLRGMIRELGENVGEQGLRVLGAVMAFGSVGALFSAGGSGSLGLSSKGDAKN
jgi:hypothetical protein